MVRLKATGANAAGWASVFQFLMVRLKEFVARNRYLLVRSFNSLWFD